MNPRAQKLPLTDDFSITPTQAVSFTGKTFYTTCSPLHLRTEEASRCFLEILSSPTFLKSKMMMSTAIITMISPNIPVGTLFFPTSLSICDTQDTALGLR